MFAELHQRLDREPALPRLNLFSVRLIQTICFQTVTHSSAQRETSIPFSFNHFRTLFSMTGGAGGCPESLTFGRSNVPTRQRVLKPSPLFPLWNSSPTQHPSFFSTIYALPILQVLSFDIHACNGGVPPSQLFRRSDLRTFQRVSELSPVVSNSCTLFCSHRKLNSFIFKRFRTLRAKHPGWGAPC